MDQTESVASVGVTVAGKPCTVTIDQDRVRERLRALGHTGSLGVRFTQDPMPGELISEHDDSNDTTTDTVCLNPRITVVVRAGMIPLIWPSAWCPKPFFRKRLLQTLAHELRHALQFAHATPLDPNATPKIGYVTIQWLGRGYILVALIGMVVIYYLNGNSTSGSSVLPIFVIGGVLGVLAIVYLVLAYINYHLDPLEVDARAYERGSYSVWEDCLSLE